MSERIEQCGASERVSGRCEWPSTYIPITGLSEPPCSYEPFSGSESAHLIFIHVWLPIAFPRVPSGLACYKTNRITFSLQLIMDRCTVGRMTMKSVHRVLGHSLVCSIIRSHRSLIRLLRTAHSARALCCAHSFVRSNPLTTQ